MERRDGFTLVEMIVVLGIIVVILALLLPALLAATEAARRCQCTNNLKQLHLALQGYEGTYGAYPAGVVDTVRPFNEGASRSGFSWISMMLPQTEQMMLAGSLNFEVGVGDVENRTVRAATISSLVCPVARPRSPHFERTPGPWTASPTEDFENGLSSYVGVHHEVEKAIDVDDHGVFFLNSRIRSADVFDGLSQTLVIGETGSPAEGGWISGGRATLRNTGSRINGVEDVEPGQAGERMEWRGSLRTASELEDAIRAGDVTPPAGFVGGFSSRHRGDGAMFAFGDGSIRFLKSAVDQAVYRRLGHRDDGEAVDEDAF